MYGCFTYIYHKNQPFMLANIPVPWMIWVSVHPCFWRKKSCISPRKNQPGGVKSDASEQVLSTAWAEPRRPVFFWGDTLMCWFCPQDQVIYIYDTSYIYIHVTHVYYIDIYYICMYIFVYTYVLI